MSVRCFQNPYNDVTDPRQPLVISPEFSMQQALECIQNCFKNCPPSPRTFDGCLYTGYIGIAWAALDITRHANVPSTVRSVLLGNAKHLVEAALRSVQEQSNARRMNKEDCLSILLGQPGIWITAVMLYQQLNDMEQRNRFLEAYVNLAPHFQPEVIFQQGSDEYFIGRAGYLAGVAVLRSYTGEQFIADSTIHSICDAILQSGVNYARAHRSPCPLMYAYYGTEYLGSGHGLIGILFALMLFPSYLRSNPAADQAVQQTLLYLISITSPQTGNLPCAMDEVGPQRQRPDSDILVHWCHGATGAIMAYARAYLLWKDERYLAECRRCAETVWQRGLLKKGPGICHGVAGSGYAFLLMFRLTGELVYLHRAAMFATFMQSDTFRQARRPDCPHSLFEGLAGTACFFADLADPCKSGFPFMNPLWDVE
ncbi:hypothetical protein CRM22_002303 [Opisthorchis felineus]|uniref:LanC-like protein 3 homolog n=1 Tax=Opisthorchis felineus TaxID=147828 RepID=A0A4S2MCN1_OPIFE|nr:hypothetical protein CRM22_002303 [Opisthorchis felineus]